MKRSILSVFALLLLSSVVNVSAQGTAFSYQGQLNDGGVPANGSYDLRFGIYNAVTNGSQIGLSQTNFAVPVSNGLFTTTLDFGAGIFTGPDRWLDIAVRATNVSTFTSLVPRQPVQPVPYAIFANSASNVLGGIPAAQLTGTVPSSQIAGTYSSTVNFSSGGNTFSGTFSGNGSSLSNMNGSQITSGTVADARLTTNVALLDHSQTFTGNNQFKGANSFTNWANSFTGNFFGNGLVGWITVAGTAQQAARDTGYMLTSSNLTVVTLPPNSGLTNGDIIRISGAGTGGWRVAQNAGQSIYGNFLTDINSKWQPASSGPNTGLNGVASSADGFNMVAVAGSGGIFISVDSGQNWSGPISSYLMTCVASSADGTKLAAGNNASSPSSIVLSTNSGNNWFSPAASFPNCQAITMSADGSRLVAVVFNAKVYTSVNSGLNWKQQTSSPSDKWSSVVSSSDGSHLAAATYPGKIYTSSNYGTNWTSQPGSPSLSWRSIASSTDGSRLAAVAEGGSIYLSSDYGVTWIQQTNAPTTANWFSIASSSDGSRLIAAMNGGGIYLSANAGATWSKQPAGNQNWTAIACSANCTTVSAVYFDTGTTGGIYYGQAYFQATTAATTAGTSGSIGGSQGSAVELQYIGNGQFMPVSSAGVIWAN